MKYFQVNESKVLKQRIKFNAVININITKDPEGERSVIIPHTSLFSSSFFHDVFFMATCEPSLQVGKLHLHVSLTLKFHLESWLESCDIFISTCKKSNRVFYLYFSSVFVNTLKPWFFHLHINNVIVCFSYAHFSPLYSLLRALTTPTTCTLKNPEIYWK